MKTLNEEECNPSLKKTFKLIREGLKISFILITPVIIGFCFFRATGMIVGMGLGGILMILYLDYTGKF